MRNLSCTALLALSACANQRSTLDTVGTALLSAGVVSGATCVAIADTGDVGNVGGGGGDAAPFVGWAIGSAAVAGIGAVLVLIAESDRGGSPRDDSGQGAR